MIHKHIKSLPHHPKRVIIISLILAIAIGIFGYIEINKKVTTPVVSGDSSTLGNVTLSFPTDGKVKTVLIKAGDKVKGGEVLATLTPDNMDGSLIQAEAAYDIAKTNYQKIIKRRDGDNVDLAKAAVNYRHGKFKRNYKTAGSFSQ